jgi:hypothetical protein
MKTVPQYYHRNRKAREAWRLGADDRRYGLGRDDNPYPIGGERYCWFDGWDAEEKALEQEFAQ